MISTSEFLERVIPEVKELNLRYEPLRAGRREVGNLDAAGEVLHSFNNLFTPLTLAPGYDDDEEMRGALRLFMVKADTCIGRMQSWEAKMDAGDPRIAGEKPSEASQRIADLVEAHLAQFPGLGSRTKGW